MNAPAKTWREWARAFGKRAKGIMRGRIVRRTPNATSKRVRKLELMEQARRTGWKGRTYHSAKKFERKLERGRCA